MVIEVYSCVFLQLSQFSGAVTGPMLRSWQADPFNVNAMYYKTFDAGMCAGALTAAIGAPWMAKHGKYFVPCAVWKLVLE